MSPQASQTSPVIIIGAGPVGLSLAVALTRQGVPVAIYEREASLPLEIRASTFHAATLEKVDEWGLAAEVMAQGRRIDRLQFWDRTARRVVGAFDYGLIAGDTKFPFRLQCPQHVYAETLLRHLQAEPLAQVFFQHEYVTSREDAAGIEVTLRTPEGTTTVRGPLLCAADGANSAVRRGLDIAFEGITYEDRFLLVATNLNLSAFYPDMAPVSYVFDPEEWVICLSLTGLLRLVFQVKDEVDLATATDDGTIRQRVWRFLGEEVDFPILHRSIYRVHQRVAETFRVGRTLLLGDAAHINNPASGLGMNSGILDAACLAEQILDHFGSGRDEALDLYAQRRRQYALEQIRRYSKQRYADLSDRDPASRHERNLRYESISRDPRRARAFLLESAMLEHRIPRMPGVAAVPSPVT